MFLSNFINKTFLTNSSKNDSFLDELNQFLKSPTSTIYTIDRFEGNYAVCENSKTLKMENILISELPIAAKKGSIIRFENGIYSIDMKLKEKREKVINEKTKKAWKD